MKRILLVAISTIFFIQTSQGQILPLKSIIKIGGSNIFNNRVYQAYGSPSIGAVYYVSLTFDELLR